MNWDALYAGFRDELDKIAEVNLRGLSSETIRSYPQPQPMPSEAYEKAQAILARAQQIQLPVEKSAGAKDFARATWHEMKQMPRNIANTYREHPYLMGGLTAASVGVHVGMGKLKKKLREEQEKTADAIRPDQLPQIKRFFRKRNKNDDPPPGKTEAALSYGGHTLAGAGAAKFTSGAVDEVRQAMKKAPLSPKAKSLALAGGAALGLGNKIRKDVRRKRWQKGHHP